MVVPRRLVLAAALVAGLASPGLVCAAPAALARSARAGGPGTPAAAVVARRPIRAPGTPPGPAEPPARIAAAGAELADAATGKPLWSRSRYGRRPIASITKVMTALVVIRAGRLGRRIRVTPSDVSYANHGASNAGLHAGDVLTARQLLAAMLLPSGADAARALAVAYGPGWPAFVGKMNRLAARLRLRETHFVNFDGLLPGDVSTPANVLRLGEAAMKLAVFRDIVGRRFFWLPGGRHHHKYLWRNTNLLLPGSRDGYRGAVGIKTGWTPEAGQCLLFQAERGKRLLIGVVLDSSPVNDGASFRAATRLLSWGFKRLLRKRPAAG